MGTLTTRLGLKKPADTDPFLTSDFDNIYDTIDSYPGRWVCTSTTLPSWTAAQAGQQVYCTDTKTPLEWTGSSWVDPLAVPPGWDLVTALNTSVSPAPLGAGSEIVVEIGPYSTRSESSATATFTVGTFSSTRAGIGRFSYQVDYEPEDYWRAWRATMNLFVNGTQVSGSAFASQMSVVPYNSGTSITSVLYSVSRRQMGSFGIAPVLKGTNTVTVSFNYAAETDTPGGSSPYWTLSAGQALAIHNMHVLGSLINTSAT